MTACGKPASVKRVTRRRAATVCQALSTGLVLAALAAPFVQPHQGLANSRAGVRLFDQRFDCGYQQNGAADHWNNHRLNALELRRRTNDASIASQAIAAQAAGPSVEDIDGVAAVQDDGTVVIPPSKFNLKNSSILFTPDGDGYRITPSDIQFSSPSGAGLGSFLGPDGLAGNGDNGYRDVSLAGAQFPFFGVYYDTIYAGTNGYITFSKGDTTSRISPTALATELPRIAPLWADLEVESSGDIYYNRLDGRHTVTWNRTGSSDGISTFQAVLYDDGRIAFVYKKVKARASMVGISPGAWEGLPRPIDFSDPPVERVTGPFFETFTKDKRLDLPALMRAFYRAHSDSFDTAYVWTEFDYENPLHSFNVRNDIGGIGLRKFDYGSAYGSAARLSSLITLGNQIDWPRDPAAHVVGLNSAVSIICHELGHRWLAYVHFDAGRGVKNDLLGRENAHWSFLADTRTNAEGTFSSLMEGNAWRDFASGTSMTIESAVNYFTPLDQYLMGLRPADEVGEIPYLVTDADLKAALYDRSPASGFSVTATRKTTSVAQIAACEGPRTPDAATAPKDFRVAFILLTERGSTPANSTLEKIAAYRNALVNYFSKATGRLGTLDASLTP